VDAVAADAPAAGRVEDERAADAADVDLHALPIGIDARWEGSVPLIAIASRPAWRKSSRMDARRTRNGVAWQPGSVVVVVVGARGAGAACGSAPSSTRAMVVPRKTGGFPTLSPRSC
jgi:hypothetical protein